MEEGDSSTLDRCLECSHRRDEHFDGSRSCLNVSPRKDLPAWGVSMGEMPCWCKKFLEWVF